MPSEFRLQPSRSSPLSRLCSLAPSPPPFLLLLNTPPPKHRLYSSSPQSRKGPIRRRNNSFPLNKREREPFFLSSIPFESRRPSPPFSRIGFALSPTPTAASNKENNGARSTPRPRLQLLRRPRRPACPRPRGGSPRRPQLQGVRHLGHGAQPPLERVHQDHRGRRGRPAQAPGDPGQLQGAVPAGGCLGAVRGHPAQSTRLAGDRRGLPRDGVLVEEGRRGGRQVRHGQRRRQGGQQVDPRRRDLEGQPRGCVPALLRQRDDPGGGVFG